MRSRRISAVSAVWRHDGDSTAVWDVAVSAGEIIAITMATVLIGAALRQMALQIQLRGEAATGLNRNPAEL